MVKKYSVIYHPVTPDNDKNGTQFEELLVSLKSKDTKTFTFANSDNNGRIINQKIKDFVSKNLIFLAFLSWSVELLYCFKLR